MSLHITPVPAVSRSDSSPAETKAAGANPLAVPLHRGPYLKFKYGFDRVLALLLLIPASLVMLIVAGLVLLFSGRPIVYSQRRVGLGGNHFYIFKFRTMIRDAERGTGPKWAAQNDPRVTRIGSLLRALHLDELPQLFNVLRGEMALVGPRPERPEIARTLIRPVDRYIERHAVKPGITGLAQIYLPPDETIECVRKKVAYDLEYIRRVGLWMDIQILLCTAVRIIGIRQGIGPRMFGLTRRIRHFQRNQSLRAAADQAQFEQAKPDQANLEQAKSDQAKLEQAKLDQQEPANGATAAASSVTSESKTSSAQSQKQSASSPAQDRETRSDQSADKSPERSRSRRKSSRPTRQLETAAASSDSSSGSGILVDESPDNDLDAESWDSDRPHRPKPK